VLLAKALGGGWQDFDLQFASNSEVTPMIRKLASGEYRLYSRKVDHKTKQRRNLGTFKTRGAAEKHEREVQYFKRHSSRISSQ